MNVPLSHPAPKPTRGVFVPGLGATSLEGACWPRNLADLIASEAPGYAIDVNSYEHQDPGAFLEALQSGAAFGGAVEAAAEASPDTDLTAILALLITNGAITDLGEPT